MTEDEATKKLCPMMRYCVNPQGAICDKESAVYEQMNCQTAACMAWTWLPQDYERGEPLPMGSVPADPGWEKDGTTRYCAPGISEDRQRWRRPLPREGFCAALSSKER